MNEYCVYCHTCPNGKKYFGLTKQNPNRRWEQGERYKEQVFYRAIKKYGWNNIKHEIIADKLNLEDACKLEQSLIKKHKTNQKEYGYNKSIGGEEGRNSNYMSMEAKDFLLRMSRYRELIHPKEFKQFKKVADYMCEDYNEAQVFNKAYKTLEKLTDKNLYEREVQIFRGLVEYIYGYYHNFIPENSLYNALYVIYNWGQIVHDYFFGDKQFAWRKIEIIKDNEQLSLF